MKLWKILIVCLFLSFLLTGCWDRKDPEDRAFFITIGADAAEAGYRFSFAPVGAEEGAEPLGIEAATLADAVAQMDCRSSRKTDLGQLKTVILGGRLLEEQEKVTSLFSELEWDQSVSKKVMLLATEGTAEECVSAAAKEDSETGLFLWDFYKNTAAEVAVTKALDLDTLLTERREQAGAVVLPRITAEEGKLRLGGGAAFAPEGVFFLNDTQERAVLFLLGEAEGALIEGEYMGRTLPFRISKSRVSYEFSENGNGGILCTVDLPLEGTVQGDDVFLSEESRAGLENLFESIIKQEIENTIAVAKKAGQGDIFGILPRLLRQEPALAAGRERQELWESMVFDIRPDWK